MKAIEIYLIAYGIMTLVTFIVYAIDKKLAIDGSRRVPEAALLTLSALLGSLGGLLAMNICRHKTKHWYFWAVNVLALAAHIFLAIVIC